MPFSKTATFAFQKWQFCKTMRGRGQKEGGEIVCFVSLEYLLDWEKVVSLHRHVLPCGFMDMRAGRIAFISNHQ